MLKITTAASRSPTLYSMKHMNDEMQPCQMSISLLEGLFERTKERMDGLTEGQQCDYNSLDHVICYFVACTRLSFLQIV